MALLKNIFLSNPFYYRSMSSKDGNCCEISLVDDIAARKQKVIFFPTSVSNHFFFLTFFPKSIAHFCVSEELWGLPELWFQWIFFVFYQGYAVLFCRWSTQGQYSQMQTCRITKNKPHQRQISLKKIVWDRSGADIFVESVVIDSVKTDSPAGKGVHVHCIFCRLHSLEDERLKQKSTK